MRIFFGKFKTHDVMMPLANTSPTRFVKVIRTDEKGSDVNLAVHLVDDCHTDPQLASVVVVTNDSDLAGSLRIAKRLGKNVGVLNPHQTPSATLGQHCNFQKAIRQGVLATSLLPNPVLDAQGPIHKPASW